MSSQRRTMRRLTRSEALAIVLASLSVIVGFLPEGWILSIPNNPIRATWSFRMICGLFAVAVIIAAFRDYGGLSIGTDRLAGRFERMFLWFYPGECAYILLFSSVAANVPVVFNNFQILFLPPLLGGFFLFTRDEWVPILRDDYDVVVRSYRWALEQSKRLRSYLLG